MVMIAGGSSDNGEGVGGQASDLGEAEGLA